MSDAARISGSIRRRLALQLVGGAAVLAVILFALVLQFARQVAERSEDNILQASATSILESVAVRDGKISADIPYAALSMLGNVGDDRVFYRISAGDALLTGYGDLPKPQQRPTASEVQFDTTTYKGSPVRLVSTMRRVLIDGAAVGVTVTVAQTRNGQAALLQTVQRGAAVVGVIFFAVAVALALITASATTRPLKRLAGSVSRRGPGDLRPVESPVPTEMAPLVTSLNGFIARLRASLLRSEDFIAEAAHRVRTPLATVRSQAEVALQRVERPENRQSLREMIRAIDESSRAAGQLLDHAMVNFRADHLENSRFSLADLVRDTVEQLRPISEMRDITIALQTDGETQVQGDAILIQNAARNLLDNAIKYSPEESEISVWVGNTGHSAMLKVGDQGIGFHADDIPTLTDRFTRGTNVPGAIGSGLGLTIARDVAEAHGGQITLENQQNGPGACVSLSFPSS